MLNDHDFPASVNCQACGSEHFETELRPIKLSGFGSEIIVCRSCMAKTAEDSFNNAVSLLDEIALIVRATSSNPERRLLAIKALLSE